jgi:hypothetical protein
MKNQLSDIYEQVLLKEAEKHNLQNPGSDEVGSLKTKQDLFGTKPKAVEGPDKAKLKQGPSYQETTGTSSAPKSSSSGPKTAPAKEASKQKAEEMEDTEVDPTKEESEDNSSEKKKKSDYIKKENFTMSAFETLFKKTLMEEEADAMDPTSSVGGPEEGSADLDMSEDAGGEGSEEMEEEEMHEEEEGDLISDLRDLQDRLNSILNKLEDLESEEQEEGMDDEYSEEEFDDEFDTSEEQSEDEGAAVKESVDKLKPLNSSKGKSLMSKKNKVGRLSAKGGKAHTGKLKSEPTPKSLSDKKKTLQKGNQVSSSVKKGDFIK